MTLWAFYFLAKSYLHFRGFMHVHIASNLLLMVVLLVPIRRGDPHFRALTALRLAAALVFAGYLLWDDSWLPSAQQIVSSIVERGGSIGGVLTLAFGPIELVDAIALLSILFCCEFSSRRGFRPMALTLVLFAVIGIQNLGAASQAVGQHVAGFYAAEAARFVRLTGAANAPVFDVVFLQIGSLSWDDLAVVDGLQHPMLSRFDALLMNFNSVTSYGSPSALRLFRCLCGQTSHEQLYHSWPVNCSLVDLLRARGFRIYTVFNHADKEGNLTQALSQYARAQRSVLPEGLRTPLTNYDGTPILSDFDALKNWWEERQRSGAKRAALYYNSATLQAGAHEPVEAWWKESSAARYRRRLDQLSTDLDQFYALLDSSGRNVVVFLVPGHGAGLREGAFLRDMPSPRFTHVPVGIKLIGEGYKQDEARHPMIQEDPVSYLAIGQILVSYLRLPPFGPGGMQRSESAFSRLPQVEFLGENEAARFFKLGDDSYVFDKEKKWTRLRSSVVREEGTALPRRRS